MDNLKDLLKPEIIWFVLGIIMLIIEFTMPGLIIFFFGVSACFVGLLCLIFNLSLNAQLVIFILSSIASLMLLRRHVRKIFRGHVEEEQNIDENLKDFLGEKVKVIQKITPKENGKVEFHGTNWTAAADEEISKGTPVEIVGKENLTLKVKRI